MEEDVEIEMLLKSNETILMAAACFDIDENNVENGRNTDNTNVVQEIHEKTTKSARLIENKNYVDKKSIKITNNLSNNEEDKPKPLADSREIHDEEDNESANGTQAHITKMSKEGEFSASNNEILNTGGVEFNNLFNYNEEKLKPLASSRGVQDEKNSENANGTQLHLTNISNEVEFSASNNEILNADEKSFEILIENENYVDEKSIETINNLLNNNEEKLKPHAGSRALHDDQHSENAKGTQAHITKMSKGEFSASNNEILNADGDNTEERNSVLEEIESHLNIIPENTYMSPTTCEEVKTEKHISDEVQEQIEEHMVLKLAKGSKNSFLQITLSDSDEESLVSDDTYDDNDDCDYFINEIMADDEPMYRAVEQIRKQFGKNSKKSHNKTINELSQIQRWILDRDKLLKDLEIKLQEELRENEKKQKHVRQSIVELCAPDYAKIKEPNLNKSFFRKFGIPYFKDNRGFSSPHNEDHKRKLKRGELIITSIPKAHFWIKDDKDLFIEAIKNTLIEENRARLVNEIQKSEKMLDEPSVNHSEDELRGKIARCQDELLSVSLKSYLELISQENPDREYDWMKYSVNEFNGQHSPDECRKFWHVYLKPSVNKTSWEVQEDYKLLEIVEQMKFEDWNSIAKLLGTNRTAYQCLVHFQTRIYRKHEFSSGRWTKEEDRKLLSVINASKLGDFIPWPKVSSHMPNRTVHQIYNRWSNCLNPLLVKGRFTKEEDLLLVSGIEVFGMSYKEMSSLLTNRTCTQIRERYERYLLPKTAKVGSWSLEEDEKLLELIEKHGEQNWVAVANEMKTRSRTQARQRYAFIQKKIKAKPGWTVKQVKRRNIHTVSKVLSKTEKHVDRFKKDIEKVEKVFNLSALETDTFKIKKLKELKDTIFLKKYDLKRKKKVFSDSSDVNNLLLDYFKIGYTKLPVKIRSLKQSEDICAYSNEMLLMAKYFGHELQLPESEGEIKNNPRLNWVLKNFLLQTLCNRTSSADNPDTEASCSTSSLDHEENIDHVKIDKNGEILMKDWWHTPPVDVARLNFSEFFKRTVFDYSYGMHQDIWSSIIKRSSIVDVGSQNEAPEYQWSKQQSFYIPPNFLTTLGLRSAILSRSRLKRDAAKKGLSAKVSFENAINVDGTVIDDFTLNSNLLNQFQETMVTLFSWPKVLSVTSIDSTSVDRPILPDKNSKPRRRTRYFSISTKNIDNLINTSYDQGQYNIKVEEVSEYKPKPQEEKGHTILEQNENHKRHKVESKRGVGYNRKMKIEHLAEDVKGKTRERKIKSDCFAQGNLKKCKSKKPEVDIGSDSKSHLGNTKTKEKVVKEFIDCAQFSGEIESKSHSFVEAKYKKSQSRKSQVKRDADSKYRLSKIKTKEKVSKEKVVCAKSADRPKTSKYKNLYRSPCKQEILLQTLKIDDVEDSNKTKERKRNSLQNTKNTYSKTKKRSFVVSDRICEPQVKIAKRLCQEDGSRKNTSKSEVATITKESTPCQGLRMEWSSSCQHSEVGSISESFSKINTKKIV